MTLPLATDIVVDTKPLAAYLARMAAIQASAGSGSPLPEINFTAGTLIVGDGAVGGSGPQQPAISTLQSTGAVVHEVWRGAVIQSISVNPTNSDQIDICAVIPAVDGSGAEIGPFIITNFIVTDELGAAMIAGVTLVPKTVTYNGGSVDVSFVVSVAFSLGTVNLTAPSAAFATTGQVQTLFNANLPTAGLPITQTDTTTSGGWLARVFGIVTATKAALGAGRAATDGEFAAGVPDSGSATLWPWPTLQQIHAALAAITSSLPTSLSAYLPIAGGTLTGDLTLDGDPTTPLMAATKHYVDNLRPPAFPAIGSYSTVTQTLGNTTGSTSNFVVGSNSPVLPYGAPTGSVWNVVGEIGPTSTSAGGFGSTATYTALAQRTS